MFSRIVVAIDGSSTARRALREAIDLARDDRAALCIAHVVDLVTLAAETPYALHERDEALRKPAQAILDEAASLAREAGVEAETKLLVIDKLGDRVADEIARLAKRWKADVIVVGTHGRRGASRLFLGSVAETIVRCATTPVLLVRGQ